MPAEPPPSPTQPSAGQVALFRPYIHPETACPGHPPPPPSPAWSPQEWQDVGSAHRWPVTQLRGGRGASIITQSPGDTLTPRVTCPPSNWNLPTAKPLSGRRCTFFIPKITFRQSLSFQVAQRSRVPARPQLPTPGSPNTSAGQLPTPTGPPLSSHGISTARPGQVS